MRHACGLLVCAALSSACSTPPSHFLASNARAHVNLLAGTIGSRPTGTEPNRRAREYVLDQLRLFGFDVRVQETDARRPEVGRTAHVFNVIGVRAGSSPEGIALMAHYDSVANGPGASDDALGVAVVLEAARVLAARPRPVHTLLVFLTDGEELGLLGSAALADDPIVSAQVRAYVNLDAVGTAGPSMLFETGPGNAWLVDTWSKNAPAPHGGSMAAEAYQRLPYDTDFSMIKRKRIPGLNFAPIRDTYAHHSARDVPDRLSGLTLRQTGENVIAIVDALEPRDLSRRTPSDPIYFDLAGRIGVSYGPLGARTLAGVALLLGFLVWVKLLLTVRARFGLGRLVVFAAWVACGVMAAALAMVGATAALRAAREVYHPWYAHPGRLFSFLVAVAISVTWTVVALVGRLPPRARGGGHPMFVWAVTLPVWIALALSTEWLIPRASYLWTVPLLSASIVLGVTPLASPTVVRAVSVVILAMTGTLWIPPTVDFLGFLVPFFGGRPVITPIWVYGGVLVTLGVMLAPPLAAVVVPPHERLARPSIVGPTLLLILAATGGFAYVARAYTFERPLRRQVRYVQDAIANRSYWEVAGNEPGLDLAEDTGRSWRVGATPWRPTVPLERLGGPFSFHTVAPRALAIPARAQPKIDSAGDSVAFELSVHPGEAGMSVSLVLPAGLVPARSNLPGVLRGNRWTATYIAPPPDGVLFQATLNGVQAPALSEAALVLTRPGVPGGEVGPGLPSWLPQERAVWDAESVFIWPATAVLAGSGGAVR